MKSQEEKFENLDASENKTMTISELAKRHLNDPTHTTTDEEMRNATLDLTTSVEVDPENLAEVDNTTVIPPMGFEKKAEEASQQEGEQDRDEDSNRSLPNPYDVLS